MSRLAIAMDLGTSGFRAQAIELPSGEIISTAITTRHPLPGANVMDHLHFALELGVPAARGLMIEAVNRAIGSLGVPMGRVSRLGLCGNPIQLSLFQGIEIRDLVYAGKRKLASLGVVPPKREAIVIAAGDLADLALPRGCEVIIPPAIRHEIGADTLAMILQTGILERDGPALATDYGTNAEMVLAVDGRVITASTAAGPAMEGQQIACGMLAAPGAISDLNADFSHHRLMVLNSEMIPVPGLLVHLGNSGSEGGRPAPNPIGITGTGTIAVIHEALAAKLIDLPRILTVDGRLHLGEEIYFTEDDLAEAGKAIGAVRAGHMTLCKVAGIAMEEIRTAYLSGASGTYVDALKAQHLGMIPPRVERVCQVGNTSLAMARDLVMDITKLEIMGDMARKLRETHCMLAASETFKKIFILEFAYWTEGMSIFQYRKLLGRYGFPDRPSVGDPPVILRTAQRDIKELGRNGLKTVSPIGRIAKAGIQGCVSCWDCVAGCPENAIGIVAETAPPRFSLDHSLCSGVACRRCERICPEKVFELNQFFHK